MKDVRVVFIVFFLEFTHSILNPVYMNSCCLDTIIIIITLEETTNEIMYRSDRRFYEAAAIHT